MWIFMSEAMFSIVAHRDDPGMLLVRARVKGDIERVFAGAKVVFTPSADYRFRAEVSRDAVSRAIGAELLAIDYDNFKDSVSGSERRSAYGDVWLTMMRYQMRMAESEGLAKRRRAARKTR